MRALHGRKRPLLPAEGGKASPVTIVSFETALPVVEYGAATTLSWKLEGAPDDLTLDGVSVAGKSSLPFSPVRRQTFTLRAVKAGAIVATAIYRLRRVSTRWADAVHLVDTQRRTGPRMP